MIPSSPKAPLHGTVATDPTLVVRPPQVDVSGRWDAVLIGTAWIAYALALTSSNLTLDVARDIAQAYLVATGADWPMRGPMIGSSFYLGPLWFYLLAPAAASGSSLVVALWVGLLAGSKFLFGWLLGAAIAGPAAGRGVVLALALPAWTGFELLVFSHTNLVAATGLAFAWGCLVLWRAPHLKWVLWVVTAAVLMLHAHPSMLPWLPLALPGLIRGLRTRALPVGGLMAAVALGAGVFLPPWFAAGDGDLGLGVETLLPTAETLAQAPLAAAALARSMVTEGPTAVINLVDAWSPLTAAAIRTLALPVAAVGVAGLALQWRRLRRPIALGVAMLVLSFVFIAIMRPQTPFYMAYGPSTLLAVLLGLGLGRWLHGRIGGMVASCLLAALLGAQLHAFASLSSRGVLDVPVALTDIGSPSRRGAGPGVEQLSPIAADRLAGLLCSHPRPIHGSLAVALDVAYGVPLRMRCGLGLADLAQTGLGGEAGILGLPRLAWAALDRAPEIPVGQWGLAETIALLRPGVVRWADYRSSRDYPPRWWATGPVEEVTIDVGLEPGEVLIVTSLEHVFDHNMPATLRLGGVEQSPAWRSEWTSVWQPPLDGPALLTLTMSGRSVESIEVVILRAPSGGPRVTAAGARDLGPTIRGCSFPISATTSRPN